MCLGVYLLWRCSSSPHQRGTTRYGHGRVGRGVKSREPEPPEPVESASASARHWLLNTHTHAHTYTDTHTRPATMDPHDARAHTMWTCDGLAQHGLKLNSELLRHLCGEKEEVCHTYFVFVCCAKDFLWLRGGQKHCMKVFYARPQYSALASPLSLLLTQRCTHTHFDELTDIFLFNGLLSCQSQSFTETVTILRKKKEKKSYLMEIL